MNDDDLSELILRASAYLDGELDADEVARAEADPAVMTEVGRLSALQAQIRNVTPAAADARESAVAAALAEFDAVHAPAARPAPAAQPARVVPFRPRPSYTRWLTAAAAVVAVGVLGVVIVNGAGGDDDEAGTAALDQTASSIDAEFARTAEATAESAFAEGSANAEAAAPSFAATAAPAADVFAENAEDSAAEDLAAEDLAADEAPATTVAAASSTQPFDPGRPILDELELAAVGAELVRQREQGVLPPTPNTECVLAPFEELSLGTYQAADGAREVLIAVDPETQQTAAFDIDTCERVAASAVD